MLQEKHVVILQEEQGHAQEVHVPFVEDK